MLTDTVQFTTGKEVEAELDRFFREQGWVIELTTPRQERTLCKGDRIFYRDSSKVIFIEYKSGIQTFYTGNIFLETVSVDTANKPGWVYTCQANFILYGCLPNRKILVFRPGRLRDEIENLKQQFRVTKTGRNQNKGYNTHGVLVPLNYAEKHLAEMVIPYDPAH